jgi:enoyl-CoA hydratase/carnithine racemase
MAYSSILVDRADGVTTITLNRPERLNPLDPTTLSELLDSLDRVAHDNVTEIVVLKGKGRAFSAGGDLKSLDEVLRNPGSALEMARAAAALADRLETLDQIVIAVVEGLCVAGGLEFALCCDFIIASETASFSDGHLNFALLPGTGAAQRMAALVGVLRTKDLLLTSRFLTAREAETIGLISFCVPADEIDGRVQQLIGQLRERSFAALSAVKYIVNQGRKGTFESGVRLEQIYAHHFETSHPDPREGMRAFLEKRKPVFTRPAGGG